MKKFLILAAALCVGGFSGSAIAAEKYEFDKVHSQILFFVDHLGFAKSQGEFHDYDGSFTFDRENPENSSVNVTIKSASIDMDDEAWDTHMKSDHFFNVEAFPDMVFKSTSIAVTGEKTADITGDLTILGVTKPVVLKTVYNKSGENPYSKKFESGFSATASLKRSDFGMTYGLPGVGDEVEIRLEVEAIRQDAEEEKAAE
ncbi:MAG: YceI family protein [Alphaproteobacteria bacterium]